MLSFGTSFCAIFWELCLPVSVEVLVHGVTFDLIFGVTLAEVDSNFATGAVT